MVRHPHPFYFPQVFLLFSFYLQDQKNAALSVLHSTAIFSMGAALMIATPAIAISAAMAFCYYLAFDWANNDMPRAFFALAPGFCPFYGLDRRMEDPSFIRGSSAPKHNFSYS